MSNKNAQDAMQELIDDQIVIKTPSQYIKIDDAKIRHVWRDVESEELVYVSPDWYESNGTPTSVESGADCVYLYTEIDSRH